MFIGSATLTQPQTFRPVQLQTTANMGEHVSPNEISMLTIFQTTQLSMDFDVTSHIQTDIQPAS